MGSSDGEGLSQLYLELVHAYNKRFMLQKGQAAVLRRSQIWEKMRRSVETLSDLKAQAHSQKEAWKREAMAASAGKGTLLSLWKKPSDRKGGKLLMILILTHGTGS